jgi:CelD/BcsL family acetyltransferase involved in cellulose biosynthesis
MEPGMMRTAVALEPDRPVEAAARDAAPALSVELKPDLDLAGDDAVALDRILANRPEVAVFLSKPWLSGFFAEQAASVRPALAILREGKTLRAAVPLAVRQTLTHVRVSLLGGGSGSDRVDLVAARGFEAIASDAFLAWLDRAFGGFLLELRDVPAGSPLWGAVHRGTAEGRVRGVLQPREVHTLPYLDLREAPAADLRTAPCAQSLRSLAKHRGKLERRCALGITIIEDAGEALEAFGALVEFQHARWRGVPGGSALDDPARQRFHRRVIPLLLAAGRLRMIRLSAAARTVAVFYGLASGPWWGYYSCGYDRAWAGRIHLGQVTLGAAIELASAEGAAQFDFLKGAERIKYAWPVHERTTLDADLFSEQPGAQLTRARRATRDAAAALTKSARDLFLARP